MAEDMIGAIHDKDTMFFRMAHGTAKDAKGLEYELSSNMGGGLPIIKSEKTGKWWTVSWQSLIELAIKEGIDKEG